MEAVSQGLGVGVERFIKLHGVPTILAPVLPVLYDDTQGHSLLTETTGCLQDLVGGVESLAAVDVAQCPLGHQRCWSRQLAIAGDDLIRCTDEDGIVDGIGNGRAEGGLCLHLIVIKGGDVVLRQLSLERVATCLQMDNLRGGGRQPEILHLDNVLAIDSEVVATGHLLAYVEQQGIVACLRDVDGG